VIVLQLRMLGLQLLVAESQGIMIHAQVSKLALGLQECGPHDAMTRR